MRVESGGNRSAHSLPVSEGTRCLVLGHTHPGKAPSQGHTLGPTLRNKEEQVSLGPRILRWEDSNDLSGRFAKAASDMRTLPFGEGGRGEGVGSGGLGPVEEGIV